MNKDSLPIGSEVETFPKSERIVMNVQISRNQLALRLSEARELLETAARRDQRSSGPPSELRKLGKSLDNKTRLRVESAVGAVGVALENNVQQLFRDAESGPAKKPTAKKRYPPTLDQVLLLTIVNIGPGRMRQVLGTMLEACNGDQNAFKYAVGYLQWKRRDTLTTIASRALLPIIVADFGEHALSISSIMADTVSKGVGS